MNVKEDFQIVPTTEEEFEILKDNKFQNFIKNLGFVPPKKANFNRMVDVEAVNHIIEEETNRAIEEKNEK